MNEADLQSKVTGAATSFWTWQNAHRHLVLVLVGMIAGALLYRFVLGH